MFTIDLEGKRAWVTGGSRGIGRATALALAAAGCDVAVGYHESESHAASVVDAIKALGRRAIAVGGDVGKPEDCDRMHALAAKELGHVEILVNNAGVQKNDMFLLLGDGDWQKVLGTNLMGPVHTIRAAAKGMWARKWGRIINVSSVAAARPSRGQSNYAASKGALESLTQALAVELAPRNIAVNCIAPGPVDTDIWNDDWDAAKREILVRRQLVKRFGTPEEVAAWVVMLASSYGAMMTGETIHLNGGAQRAWDGDKS